MTSFFHYFSLRTLKAMRTVKDIQSKVEKMLAWAETNYLETAIHRGLFIIAKYIEVLLRKFLEARSTNIVSGLPTTAIDQRNLGLLSAAHQQAIRNLLRQMRAHGLKWTRPVSSLLFEEPNLERGFFIPRNHKTIFSPCWIRNLRKIEGSWVVEEGYDRLVCKCTKCVSSDWLSLPARNFVTDLSPICLFFRPVQGMDSQLPHAKSWGWYRILDSVLQDFSAQISPVVDITSAPTDFVLPSPHQSSSSASSMLFTDDILQGTETAVEQILEPVTATATDFNAQFAQIRDSISQISIKQVRTQRILDDLKSELLFKIGNLDSAESRDQQTQFFQNSIKSVCQEARTQGDVVRLSAHN
ncbi:hypothetical protein F511_09885 [Dorcoceras hygrometricum]|uniref:Uncharacterized protein n=1 Tax=Dorcoceras hygrometricum TaxID=472368 RepID=A0A2Z7CXW1_9LAMI|nr:hypothetical protein F511_09885 [Dorcoceras hygrometricum]